MFAFNHSFHMLTKETISINIYISFMYLDVVDPKVRSLGFVDSPEKCNVKFELVVFSCFVS